MRIPADGLREYLEHEVRELMDNSMGQYPPELTEGDEETHIREITSLAMGQALLLLEPIIKAAMWQRVTMLRWAEQHR